MRKCVTWRVAVISGAAECMEDRGYLIGAHTPVAKRGWFQRTRQRSERMGREFPLFGVKMYLLSIVL